MSNGSGWRNEFVTNHAKAPAPAANAASVTGDVQPQTWPPCMIAATNAARPIVPAAAPDTSSRFPVGGVGSSVSTRIATTNINTASGALTK